MNSISTLATLRRATPWDPIGDAMGALTKARIYAHGMTATGLPDMVLETRSLALQASQSLLTAAQGGGIGIPAFPARYRSAAGQAKRAAALLARIDAVVTKEGELGPEQRKQVERLLKRATFLIDHAWTGAYTGTHY